MAIRIKRHVQLEVIRSLSDQINEGVYLSIIQGPSIFRIESGH
jgi:hypothetical protein